MSSGWAPRARIFMGDLPWPSRRLSALFQELYHHCGGPGEAAAAAGFAGEGVVVFGEARLGDELEAGADDVVGDVGLADVTEAVGDHVVHHKPGGAAPVALGFEARVARVVRGDDEFHIRGDAL